MDCCLPCSPFTSNNPFITVSLGYSYNTCPQLCRSSHSQEPSWGNHLTQTSPAKPTDSFITVKSGGETVALSSLKGPQGCCCCCWQLGAPQKESPPPWSLSHLGDKDAEDSAISYSVNVRGDGSGAGPKESQQGD